MTSREDEFRVKPVLDGTVAMVTGASSGIGAATAATATALAAQGAAVALAALRADRVEAVAADIKDQGGTALVLECDITDEQQVAAAVERAVAELGRLDTLINNALTGEPHPSPRPNGDDRAWLPSPLADISPPSTSGLCQGRSGRSQPGPVSRPPRASPQAADSHVTSAAPPRS